jgi:aminoglycoside/choline kinase family phosphotransferase
MTLSSSSIAQTAQTADADPRAAARTDWARAATGDNALVLERASMDAGFRSYWRGRTGDGTVIVMDSPPDKEDVRPWLQVRELIRASGVRVPDVLAGDEDAGFLLLEDLGHHTYLHVIDADNADALFDAAVGQLLLLQATPVPEGFPAYDEALLARELRLFDEWFLGRHLGVTLDCGDLERLELVYRRLIDAALAQPTVLVHRDFMPRNLMPVGADGPAMLDFQDAVSGPIAYDPICLFKDAFLSWPEHRVDAWLDRYRPRPRRRPAGAAAGAVPPRCRLDRRAPPPEGHRHLRPPEPPRPQAEVRGRRGALLRLSRRRAAEVSRARAAGRPDRTPRQARAGHGGGMTAAR